MPSASNNPKCTIRKTPSKRAWASARGQSIPRGRCTRAAISATHIRRSQKCFEPLQHFLEIEAAREIPKGPLRVQLENDPRAFARKKELSGNLSRGDGGERDLRLKATLDQKRAGARRIPVAENQVQIGENAQRRISISLSSEDRTLIRHGWNAGGVEDFENAEQFRGK